MDHTMTTGDERTEEQPRHNPHALHIKELDEAFPSLIVPTSRFVAKVQHDDETDDDGAAVHFPAE